VKCEFETWALQMAMNLGLADGNELGLGRCFG